MQWEKEFRRKLGRGRSVLRRTSLKSILKTKMLVQQLIVAWLVGAIKRSDQDHRFIPIIKVTIGNYSCFTMISLRHIRLIGNK